jgi:hypothetical protein
MAIVLEANYSKKLGLPEFSSHQYSVTLRTEVTDLGKVDEETARLYSLLQTCVDRSLQQAGFVPGKNGNGNGHPHNGNGNGEHWVCSLKQKNLILKLVEENKLDKDAVERKAMDMFGKGVKALNKLEASGLIEELFRQTGISNGSRNWSRFPQPEAR